MAAQDPYEDTFEKTEGVHPVDDIVERRLRHKALRRKIAGTMNDIVKALGPKRRLLLALETQINERQMEREREYFNLGYEAGSAAGHEKALRTIGPGAPRSHRQLTKQIRSAIARANASSSTAHLIALLIVAWSIAVAGDAGNSRSARRRRRR